MVFKQNVKHVEKVIYIDWTQQRIHLRTRTDTQYDKTFFTYWYCHMLIKPCCIETGIFQINEVYQMVVGGLVTQGA